MDSVKTMPIEETMPIGARLDANAPLPGGFVDTTPFIGCWLSTNRDTQGIAKLVVHADDRGDGHDLLVQAFGADVPTLCEWGEVKGVVFADGPASHTGLAFRAFYDFGFKETIVQAKVKKGVLVVANFNRFKDGSRRANYFSREFFYRPVA
jgi:hypothetical protein